MEVLDVLPEGLHILVDGVGRHAADLHQAVMLDEDCVAGQITVDDWFLDRNISFLPRQSTGLTLKLWRYLRADKI